MNEEVSREDSYKSVPTTVVLKEGEKFFKYPVDSETGDTEGDLRLKVKLAQLEARLTLLEKTVEALK